MLEKILYCKVLLFIFSNRSVNNKTEKNLNLFE